VDVYKRTSYPGTFTFGSGCPARPLCGNTYGPCSFRTHGAEVFALDAREAHSGSALTTLGTPYVESIPLGPTPAAGIEITKARPIPIVTPGCPGGYTTEAMIDLADVRVFGYPESAASRRLNHASPTRGASATLSPPVSSGAERYPPERAINAWLVDHARTAGGGPQSVTVTLAHPIIGTSVRVTTPDPAALQGAILSILVDGESWEPLSTLPTAFVHDIALPADRLVAAVRVDKEEVQLSVSEIEVLGTPR
jgi:hypothetical protein